MREIIPSQLIPAGPGGPLPLPAAPGPLPDPPVWRLDGSTATAAEVFADTYTDALVVLHDGRLVAERYDAGMTAATPHLLMSVSKSIVGCVAGVLADRGLLDPGAPVTAYVPEAGVLGIRRGHHPQPARHADRGRVPRDLHGPGRRGPRDGAFHGLAPGAARRPGGRVPVPDHPGPGRPARRRVHLPLGRQRHARLGVRAGQRHPDGRPHLGAHLAADRGRTGRRDHLRSAGFGHPRRRRLRDRARPGQVRADAHRRRHGPGPPGGPGGLAGRHPRPGPRRPRGLRGHRPTSSSCRAAGIATSSGSSRGTAARCWSASASTAS